MAEQLGFVVVSIAALTALCELDPGNAEQLSALSAELAGLEGAGGVPLVDHARQVLAAG